MTSYRICMVCSGNICRSPMAEVILRERLAAAGVTGVEVDSAGVGDWHVGDGADRRAVSVLRAHGYDGSTHRARQFDRSWFAERDLILVADASHVRDIRAMAPDEESRAKVQLLRDYDPASVGQDLADPYWGDTHDFEQVLAEVEAAADGVLRHIRELRAGSAGGAGSAGSAGG